MSKTSEPAEQAAVPASKLDIQYGYGTTDNNGNILTQSIGVSTSVFNQTYSYDALNRLTGAQETPTSGTAWSQAFSYDRYGNRTLTASSTGLSPFVSTPTIDTATNRFVTTGGAYGYDYAGNLTQEVTVPGSLTSRFYAYDAENHMTLAKQGTSSGSATTTGGYIYDGEGRRVKKTTADNLRLVYNQGAQLIAEYDLNGSASVPKKEYTYGASGLLATINSAGGSTSAAPGTGTVTISGSENSYSDIQGMHYDSGTVSITVNGYTSSVSYGQTSTSASVANALMNQINGDPASPVTATLSGTTLTLVARQAGASTNYTLSTSSTHDFHFDPSFTGAVSGSTLTGGANASSGGSPVTLYTTSDHLGSPRVITDSNGNPVERHDYVPFGEEIPTSFGNRNTITGYGVGILRQKFTSKERDTETGLDYFGARYLSSAQGRFTSVDPLLQSARPSLPQSWDRYSYVLNNPLKYIDPSGEKWEFVGNQDVSAADLKKAFEAGIKAKGGKDWEKSKEWQAYQAIENAKGTIKVALGALKSDTQFGNTNTDFTWSSKNGKLTSLEVSGTITINTNSKAIDISNFTDLVTAGSHEFNHVLSGLATAKVPGLDKLAPVDHRSDDERAAGVLDFGVEAAAFRAQVNAEEVTRTQDKNRPVSPDTALGRATRQAAGTKTDSELYDLLSSPVWGSKFKQPRP